MPTLKIDDQEITVAPGTTILQAAQQLGIFIPHYCYHPGLKLVGSCRMCLVEEERSVKLIPSCAYPVTDGMIIYTNSDKVVKARKAVMEFFLINHPLDCPVCDKAGECELQNYAYTYGQQHSRMTVAKTRFAKKDLGTHVLIWPERCILCSRCVRFCQEISGTSELFVLSRGDKSEISVMPGKRLENRLSGNVIQLCPVGALISKDFLYKSRVWYLKKATGICPACSRGCNTEYEHRNGRIYRTLARFNPHVNDYWICDDGRYALKAPEKDARIHTALLRKESRLREVSREEVYTAAKMKIKSILEKHGPGQIGGIGSPCCTNEDNYMLRRFLAMIGAKEMAMLPPVDKNDREAFPGGFVISSEKAPNRRGAAAMLGVPEDPAHFRDMLSKMEQGLYQALFLVRDFLDVPLEGELLAALRKVPFLFAFESVRSELLQAAYIILPCAMFFEKEGTMNNDRNRLQHFNRVLLPSTLDIQPPWSHLAKLMKQFDEKIDFSNPSEVFDAISLDIPGYKNIDYGVLRKEGFDLEPR